MSNNKLERRQTAAADRSDRHLEMVAKDIRKQSAITQATASVWQRLDRQRKRKWRRAEQ